MHAVFNVSLARDTVDIPEGDTGSFCAVIVDPTVVLERDVPVNLSTMGGTATSEDPVLNLMHCNSAILPVCLCKLLKGFSSGQLLM